MKVYLAGAINGCTDSQCNDWRAEAKSLLHAETLDPMSRDYRGKEDESVDAIVDGDKEDIRASDVVLVNAAAPSWGTAMEIHLAYTLGKRVIAIVPGPRVSPWLRYHTMVVQSLQAACEYINELES